MKTNAKVQERTDRELAIRFKRQRAATEALHKLARAKGIDLETDAIAQPHRVVMDVDRRTRKGFYEYVIVSRDGKKLLTFNMISGEERVLDNDSSIVLDVFRPAEMIERHLDGVLAMALSEEVVANRASKLVDFRFDRWFVLEILQDGHFFYVQREMTQKLRAYADEHGLSYHIHCRDRLASRAKLAGVGAVYWSLRCEDPSEGNRVYYVLYDPKTEAFVVAATRPQVWVLQQRVAASKIETAAKKLAISTVSRPLLAYYAGRPVWASYVSVNDKDKFLVCPIDGQEVHEIGYSELTRVQDMKKDKFKFDVLGFEMYAKQWLEAEFAVNTHRD